MMCSQFTKADPKKIGYLFKKVSLILLSIVNFSFAQHIAVTQIVDHPALNDLYKGMVDAIHASGYDEKLGLRIEHQVAQSNIAISAQIAEKFLGDKPDVVVAISTPSAQSAVFTIKKIPIVFSAVSDPISANIVSNLDKPDQNVTGIIDTPHPGQQIEFIKKLAPNAKKIGIIYNSGEINSVSTVKDLKDAAESFEMIVIESVAAKASDVSTAALNLVGKVDIIYIPLDNTVVSALDSVLKVANTHKIPVFSADSGSVEKGAVASVGFDYYEVGIETGEMVVKILQGEKIENIPVSRVKNVSSTLNTKAAELQGLNLSDEVLSSAKKIYTK